MKALMSCVCGGRIAGVRAGLSAALGCAGLALCAGSALGQADFRPLAMAGQAAPGLPGVTFESVGDPKLGQGGKAAFWAKLAGTGVTTSNQESIWTDRESVPGAPPLLAYRSGAAAPGTTGVWGGMAGYAMTGQNLLAFAGSIVEGTNPTNVVGYFGETAYGVMALRAREVVNGPYMLPALVAVNDSTNMAWSGGTNAPNQNGTTLESSTGILLNTSTALPGGAAGVTFRRFSQPTFTELGVAVFRAFYGATTTGADWQSGLFMATAPSDVMALARQGDVAGGLGAGVTFAEFGGSPIARTGNATAAVYTWARVQGAGITSINDAGIFRVSGGMLTAVVMNGDGVPGLPGVTLGTISRRVSITPTGGIAFHAILAGATPGVDNAAIFVKEDGEPLRMLAQRGQRLGRMPDGSVVDVLGEPRVSASGHLVFSGQIKGGGASGQALFSKDAISQDDLPRMLLRAGMPFQAAGQPVRTIRSITFDHESEEVSHAQIVGRTLAVSLTFEDRASGVFIGTLTCTNDFDGDGDIGTDSDIEAFFACLAGNCCATCPTADYNGDGTVGDDADIEAFFRVMAGGAC